MEGKADGISVCERDGERVGFDVGEPVTIAEGE